MVVTYTVVWRKRSDSALISIVLTTHTVNLVPLQVCMLSLIKALVEFTFVMCIVQSANMLGIDTKLCTRTFPHCDVHR